MGKVKESSRKAPLLYLNLHAKVFEYFKVLLEDDKCIKVANIVINQGKLESLNYRSTSSGQWLHEYEYSEKRTSSKPTKPTLIKIHILLT